MPLYRICTTEFNTSERAIVIYSLDIMVDGAAAKGYTSTIIKDTIFLAKDDVVADKAFELYVGTVKKRGAKSWTVKLQEIKKDGVEICVIREIRSLTEADASQD